MSAFCNDSGSCKEMKQDGGSRCSYHGYYKLLRNKLRGKKLSGSMRKEMETNVADLVSIGAKVYNSRVGSSVPATETAAIPTPNQLVSLTERQDPKAHVCRFSTYMSTMEQSRNCPKQLSKWYHTHRYKHVSYMYKYEIYMICT